MHRNAHSMSFPRAGHISIMGHHQSRKQKLPARTVFSCCTALCISYFSFHGGGLVLAAYEFVG